MNYDKVFALIIPVAGNYLVTTGHSNKVRHTEICATVEQALKFLENTGFSLDGKTAESRLQFYVFRMVD